MLSGEGAGKPVRVNDARDLEASIIVEDSQVTQRLIFAAHLAHSLTNGINLTSGVLKLT